MYESKPQRTEAQSSHPRSRSRSQSFAVLGLVGLRGRLVFGLQPGRPSHDCRQCMAQLWLERERREAAEDRAPMSKRLATMTKYGRCPTHKEARAPVAYHTGPSTGFVTLRCKRWFESVGDCRSWGYAAAAAQCTGDHLEPSKRL